MENLANLQIITDCGKQDLINYSTETSATVTAIFRDLEERLIKEIEESDFVVGCVAWLTNPRILESLSKPRWGTSIVVQKEDFLRPDSKRSSKLNIRTLYDAISCRLTRYDIPGIISTLSVGGDPSLPSIRCVGNHNRDRLSAFPRMHNKFVVFCKMGQNRNASTYEPYPIKPKRVWTGSFNFTETATFSFENAIIIDSPEIATAYFNEWAQILALSEPLDWTSDWAEPEWRIGT